MNPAIQSGMFMPSETAIISDSVLDLEFSFWTLELVIKNPAPKMMHIPEVDFMKSRLANAASIDTVRAIVIETNIRPEYTLYTQRKNAPECACTPIFVYIRSCSNIDPIIRCSNMGFG